ncbi:uncharacterized protein LOC135958790 [Calliphora vicina]|uniref:uncharacterized protein LOC135958790 n=1 Tax=Calliphora vicina TaxID=7373 RepID=UPI00325ADDB8
MVSKQFLTEFIEILKENNAIWQINSEKYKDKNEKQKSWEKLLSKFKEFDKNATIEMTKKKYHAIRACHRRELQKIRRSEKSGADSEHLYVPTLWYFDHLDFLRDQVTNQLDEIAAIDDDSFEEEIEKEPSFKKQAFDPTIFLQTDVNHQQIQNSRQNHNKDDADIYSESWAVTFRKLKPDQKIFAKRLMDDALMYAQLGQLSLSSSINPGIETVELPFHPTILHCDNTNSSTSMP